VTDPDAIAAARHTLGGQLAEQRKATGYTQLELADLLGYSRSTIANVERGKQQVPEEFWAACDKILGTGREFGDAAADLASLIRRRDREREERRRAERRMMALVVPPTDPQARAAFDWPADLRRARQNTIDLWSIDLTEQGTGVEVGGALSTAVLRWSNARPDDSVANDSDGWSTRPADVDRIRAVRRHLKEIDNESGGGVAFHVAVAYLRHDVAPLVRGKYGDHLGRGLLGATAEMMHDVGWMAYDAQDHMLARRYLVQALRLSHAADNTMLCVRILAALSHQALHLSDVESAIALAETARATTAGDSPPKVEAMLAAMEACAQAAGGHVNGCKSALDAAGEALNEIGDRQDPEWLDFDEGGLWGHAARAYRDLAVRTGQRKHAAEAENYASRSIGLCQLRHSRTRAQRKAILATAQVQLGDLDAASATGNAVVEDAWNLNSGLVNVDIARLMRTLRSSGMADQNDGFPAQAHEYLSARARQAVAIGCN
jgi:transcriptional regulator with XRE-family HTH domain